MRIIQRNVLNSVGEAVVSEIRIWKAKAPTALHMDNAAEITERGPRDRTKWGMRSLRIGYTAGGVHLLRLGLGEDSCTGFLSLPSNKALNAIVSTFE
jgi:hypothetical protein